MSKMINGIKFSEQALADFEMMARVRENMKRNNELVKIFNGKYIDFLDDNQDTLAAGITLPSGAKMKLVVRRELTLI